jgi:hypothetical protein
MPPRPRHAIQSDTAADVFATLFVITADFSLTPLPMTLSSPFYFSMLASSATAATLRLFFATMRRLRRLLAAMPPPPQPPAAGAADASFSKPLVLPPLMILLPRRFRAAPRYHALAEMFFAAPPMPAFDAFHRRQFSLMAAVFFIYFDYFRYHAAAIFADAPLVFAMRHMPIFAAYERHASFQRPLRHAFRDAAATPRVKFTSIGGDERRL